MTLIDDLCDGCGGRFDPMGDPLLTRHPEISEYAVLCATCEQKARMTAHEQAADVDVAEKARTQQATGIDKWSSLDHGRMAHWWVGNEGTACGRDFRVDIQRAYSDDRRCRKCVAALTGPTP